MSYRSNNSNYGYQRQSMNSTVNQSFNNEQQQAQIMSPSSARESLDDSLKQMTQDNKQITEIELNMNCSDEQLSEAQLANCPVKVR